ncbi:MAG: RNA polymerase sigma-70 factor [Bacteroidetes bacterium]|nr:RNA polymerase sigma-70 factor [Bacteroidota bacterium]
MKLEDTEILAGLKKSDKQVFEQLFRSCYAPLCIYAAGIVSDKDEAEDIVQQTMITFWEKRETIEISTSVKSYLYRAVHNQALNKIRHDKVRQVYSKDVQSAGEQESEAASGKILQQEMQTKIAEAINQLPDQCRTVFQLSRFENLKYLEIANHLGISVKTVENHMGKALRLMRISLKDYLPLCLLWLINLFS